jgi:hypothetical protein
MSGSGPFLEDQRLRTEQIIRERDEARALLLKVMETGRAALVEIAERQRAACARRLFAGLLLRDGTEDWVQVVNETPLVTEEQP